jgi:hypothetical protein
MTAETIIFRPGTLDTARAILAVYLSTPFLPRTQPRGPQSIQAPALPSLPVTLSRSCPLELTFRPPTSRWIGAYDAVLNRPVFEGIPQHDSVTA